jgi:Zn-dependent protease with chaperone function
MPANGPPFNAKPFADQWDFNPLRYRFGIAAINAVNIAALSAAAAYSFAAGSGLRFAFCAAAAGVIQIAKTPVLREVLHRQVIAPNSAPAPQEVLDHVAFYMNRAGIGDYEVRVMHMPVRNREGDKEKRMRITMNCGAAILAARNSHYRKPTLLIGRDALRILNRDELTAVLCHEISHVKNPNSPKGNSLINFGITTNMLLAVTTYLFDPGLALIGAAAWTGGKILRAFAGRVDEHRADYNSCGQYPHPTALTDSLKKISAEMQRQLGPRKQGYFSALNARLSRALLDEHPSLPRRAAAHEKRLQPALAFYRARNLPLPL